MALPVATVRGPGRTVTATLETFTVIFAIAVVSPLISDACRPLRISALVFEILAGAVVGPGLLNVVRANDAVSTFSELGLAFLMFLAGFELDFAKVRGHPIATAGLGWLVSLVVGFGIGLAAAYASGATSWAVISLGIATTGLVMLVPLWRDADMMETRFGVLGMAVGTAGEFGPIVAISLVLTDRSALRTGLVLLAFAAANRFRFTPTLIGSGARRAATGLRWSILAETLIGLFVVVLAGILANLPPNMIMRTGP